MTREEFVKSRESVVAGIQLKLLNLVEDYMNKNNLKSDALAERLEVPKEYISQVFNVSFDYKVSEFVDFVLTCNAMPLIFFVNLDEFVKSDASDKVYELVLVSRPKRNPAIF